MLQANVVVGNVDSRDLHRIVANVLEQVDVAVFQDKHLHPKASATRSERGSSREHTHPPRFSFALAMVLTMTARRFQSQRILVRELFTLRLSVDQNL